MEKSAIFRDLVVNGDAIREKIRRPGDGVDSADGDRSETEGMPRCRHIQTAFLTSDCHLYRIRLHLFLLVLFFDLVPRLYPIGSAGARGREVVRRNCLVSSLVRRSFSPLESAVVAVLSEVCCSKEGSLSSGRSSSTEAVLDRDAVE